jgi:hypothetical protein
MGRTLQGAHGRCKRLVFGRGEFDSLAAHFNKERRLARWPGWVANPFVSRGIGVGTWALRPRSDALACLSGSNPVMASRLWGFDSLSLRSIFTESSIFTSTVKKADLVKISMEAAPDRRAGPTWKVVRVARPGDRDLPLPPRQLHAGAMVPSARVERAHGV